MTKLLKKLSWYLRQARLEQDLLKYVQAEYRSSDHSWAFEKTLAAHKSSYLGGV